MNPILKRALEVVALCLAAAALLVLGAYLYKVKFKTAQIMEVDHGSKEETDEEEAAGEV
jgi:uncharacterized protein YoxC